MPSDNPSLPLSPSIATASIAINNESSVSYCTNPEPTLQKSRFTIYQVSSSDNERTKKISHKPSTNTPLYETDTIDPIEANQWPELRDRQATAMVSASPIGRSDTAAYLPDTLPPGLKYLLNFRQDYLFLLFANPEAIMTQRSPLQYEKTEPGCTAAWCRCMSQVIDWIIDDKAGPPFITVKRYLEINRLITENVQNMELHHRPGKLRRGKILYPSIHHTHKGIIQALNYKHSLEQKYDYCRGSRNSTITENSMGIIRVIPDTVLLWHNDNKSSYFWPPYIEGKRINFHPIAPNNHLSGDDIVFKYQLWSLLEREIISPLNLVLTQLQHRSIPRDKLLFKLIRIAATYWPRLEQIHPPNDGTCRTNYLLMQFIFMSFGFPPPLLKDPNEVDLVHTHRCEKIIQIGLLNSLKLIKADHPEHAEIQSLIVHSTTRWHQKAFSCWQGEGKYEQYHLPKEFMLSQDYEKQMHNLTQTLIEKLRTLTLPPPAKERQPQAQQNI